MPVEDFYFLLAGMADVTSPDSTDPMDELIQKRLREKMAERQRRPRRR